MIDQNYLELRKAELLERLNNWRTSGEEGEAMLNLIIKLVSGTAVSDPDFKAALEDETAEGIINRDLDCYTLADFVKWLSNHDFDLFQDYRFAETVAIEDAIEEIKESQEAPRYCYDFDFEEFAALEDDEERADYIKDHFDGLLYSNSTLVISW